MPKENSVYFRKKARSVALQALYEADVTNHPVDASFKWIKEEAVLPKLSGSYAQELIRGVVDWKDVLDSCIHKYATAWPVQQLPVVDRNILRLALFEICIGKGSPNKVAINEAVELAKTFGSESSPRFVNGVLGSVMDEMIQSGPALPEATMVVMGESG